MAESNATFGTSSFWKKLLLATIAVVALIIIALIIISFFSNRWLRSEIVNTMNSKLTGYHAQIDRVHLQLLTGNLTLSGITLVQNAHPSPPVAEIPQLVAHIEWRQIFRGHVVADFTLVQPNFHINLVQLREEETSKVPVSKEGWQDALQSIYPFKIDRFTIIDGKLTYVDVDPQRPLRLSQINLVAGNIRNIIAPKRTYPSTLSANAIVFEQGRLKINGQANFLAKPFAGVWLRYWITNLPLTHFEPIIQRANFSVRDGVLQSSGVVQYAPWIEQVEVYDLAIDDIKLNYVHKMQTAVSEEKHVHEAKHVAEQANNKQGLKLRVDKAAIEHASLSYTDEAKNPQYRLYLTDLALHITNFSNHFYEGPSKITIQGLFMGSGESTIDGTFRPEIQGPDFSLNLAIVNTNLVSLNDLLRAYGKLDVARGNFSLFAQLAVKEGQMSGYVKPLFSNVQVYSIKKDIKKPLLKQAYEIVVGAASHLFKNHRTEKVATQVNLSGSLDNPRMSSWQAFLELLRNAFEKAILPGFDRQVGQVNR